MQIDVATVRSSSDLKSFISLSKVIYRNNSQWVAELHTELKKRLDKSTYPFFDHAKAEFFLARKNDRTVGRIAAIRDESHIDFHQEPAGFFGFFECIDNHDVATALFSHAAHWLKNQQLEVMRGPMSYSTNDECGLLIDGFDSPPVIMMPYNPPYYLDLIEKFGFSKAKDLLAYEMTDDVLLPARLTKIVERTKQRKKIVIRPLDKKHIHHEVEHIKEIYNSAWKKNWGFVPMTEREIDYMATALLQIIDPNIVLFAEVGNEPIAFILALPDFNQALKQANGRLFPFGLAKILWHARKISSVRILAFGIKEAYRQQGIDALLYYEVFQAGVRRGYHRGELSWILEDNLLMNRALENMGAKVYKRYRIFDYPLS